MSSYEAIELSVGDDGVARLTLNRPDARNAMSQQMIDELSSVAGRLREDDAIRVVVLSGKGEIFCAGGDLKGMQQQAIRTRDERISYSRSFAERLAKLDTLPKPVIGRINGLAFGGGLGLISVCDLAIGVTTSKFALTEVRLGLIPATISPYVVARLGVPNSRRVMLNAREMTGSEAARLGLLSECVEPDQLDAVVNREVSLALKCAPRAVATAKELIRYVSSHGTPDNIVYTAERLADAWESEELQEGIAGFLMKRKPNWDKS